MFTIYPWEGGQKNLSCFLGGSLEFQDSWGGGGGGQNERFPMSRAPKTGPSCSKAD